jgi:uncharacterized protein
MPTIVFGSILIAFLIFVYPLLDIKFSRPMKEKKDTASRLLYFKYAIVSEWLIVFIILAFVLLSANTVLADIGLTMSENAEKFYGMIVGFLVGVGIVTFVLMKIPFYKKSKKKQSNELITFYRRRNSIEIGLFLSQLRQVSAKKLFTVDL